MFTHIIHHECSDGPANFIVGLGFPWRTEEDEKKPARTQVWKILNYLNILIVGMGVCVCVCTWLVQGPQWGPPVSWPQPNAQRRRKACQESPLHQSGHWKPRHHEGSSSWTCSSTKTKRKTVVQSSHPVPSCLTSF